MPDELPDATRRSLDGIEKRLAEVVGGDPWDEVAPNLRMLLSNALFHASRARRPGLEAAEGPPLDMGGVVAWNVRALRLQAGWTQVQVAEAMAHAGFDWKRITVAEVEAGSRRVQLDEMLALAALYGVPVVSLLLPDEDVAVVMRDGRYLAADVVQELVVGAGGHVGDGGPDWPVAEHASRTPEGARPAAEYWRAAWLDQDVRRRRREER